MRPRRAPLAAGVLSVLLLSDGLDAAGAAGGDGSADAWIDGLRLSRWARFGAAVLLCAWVVGPTRRTRAGALRTLGLVGTGLVLAARAPTPGTTGERLWRLHQEDVALDAGARVEPGVVADASNTRVGTRVCVSSSVWSCQTFVPRTAHARHDRVSVDVVEIHTPRNDRGTSVARITGTRRLGPGVATLLILDLLWRAVGAALVALGLAGAFTGARSA